MDSTLLHVLHFTLSSEASVTHALRAARHASFKKKNRSILLFAFLPDTDAESLPHDVLLLKKLQSGVMAMNARSQSEFLLLVPRRTWDDASRAYWGEKLPCKTIIAQLIKAGETDAAFAAATVSPSSLKGRFSHILFSDLSLSCTPDMPERMLEALEHSSSGCICAHIRERNSFPQTALTRLCKGGPFALSPLLCTKENHLLRKGFGVTDTPTLYTADALASAQNIPASPIPAAAGCFFVRCNSPTLPGFFKAHRRLCLTGSIWHALIPLLQLVLLFVCALMGQTWPALLAALPEIQSLFHPKLLPGALVRLALLPLTACVSLDALLCRLLARSRLIRLRVPNALFTPQGCAIFGAVLLPAAMVSAQALVPLLPVSLLWLAAPLIIPVLDAPTIERIPLDVQQRRYLQTLAESAFFDSADAACSPSMRMLVSCAGCMLGLLEPDEAARQIQSQLAAPPSPSISAAEFCAQLAAAQWLRESMGKCDAALRDLPAAFEARTLSQTPERSCGKLSALLSAALLELSTPDALERLAHCEIPEPSDLLFLPMQRSKDMPLYPVSLPLTHPHTFLKHQMLSPDTAARPSGAAIRFLFLAAAALDHPFYPLLTRSPVAGPYMVLLTE